MASGIARNTQAHAVGNAVERAYARDDGLEQRRTIMIAWAEFLSKPDNAGRKVGKR